MTKYKRNFEFDNNIIETIAYNVIKYRKIAGITQEQLAIDIDVSPEFIRKFESTKGSEGLSLLSLYKEYDDRKESSPRKKKIKKEEESDK